MYPRIRFLLLCQHMSISRASNYDATAHTHTAGAAWRYDAENHWKLCTEKRDNYVMNKGSPQPEYRRGAAGRALSV